MEKGHLHHGVDARAQPAFAGNFCRVDDIKTGVFLPEHRLHFLRQTRPHLIRAVRRVEQENTARFQALCHLIFVDKLQLVTADKIGLRYQIGRVDRPFADAQVGNRQPARFFGVIDKVTLGVPRRRVANNLDIVLGRRDAAIAAKPIEERFQFGVRRQGVFRQRQGEVSNIIINADGEARLRFIGAQLIKDGQDTLRAELFRRQSVAAANHARQGFALTAIKGFRQRGHHIEIERLCLRARLFGAIQHRHAAHALRQHRQKMRGAEGAIEPHFQHADFLAACQQLINHLFAGANRRAHQHDHPLRLRMAIVLKGFVVSTRGGGKIIHRLLNMVVNGVVPRVCRFTGLEIGVRVRRGAADHRVFRVERSRTMLVNLLLGHQRAQGVVRERHDLVYLVRSAKTIKEVNKWHAAFQRRDVGDKGKILCFLHATGAEQGTAGLAHRHHIGVVAKNRQRMGGNGSRGNVQHKGS